MKYLIIGGTGSLGKAMLTQLVKDTRNEITVLSRSELNQLKLKEIYPNLDYVLGDIRDYEGIKDAVAGHDVVFHFAALKYVDVMEKNISESIKTNILGTINVARACVEQGVGNCIFSSTDKGVLPINVYGACKFISERYLLGLNASQDITKFSIYRWGNVLASSGSAIPFFIKSLRSNQEVQITDTRMGRFWIPIDKACNFILDTYEHSRADETQIPVMKAATVERIVQVLSTLLGINKYKIKYVGLRPGEKIHECLYHDIDSEITSENVAQYSEQELFDLLEPIVEKFK